MVHHNALPSEQDMQAAITEPSALMRQVPQPLPQFRIVRPASRYRTVIRTQPIVLHARRSLMSNAQRR